MSGVWQEEDREVMSRIFGSHDLPDGVEEMYFRVQRLMHSVVRPGPLPREMLIVIALFSGKIQDPVRVKSPLADVEKGTWVTFTRGQSVMRGTFQGLQEPPLDSLADIFIEDDPGMQVAIQADAVKVVELQKIPEVVPRPPVKKPQSIPPASTPVQLPDSKEPNEVLDFEEEDAALNEQSIEVFTWDKAPRGTSVSVEMDDGSIAQGEFMQVLPGGMLSVKIGGARAKSFPQDQVIRAVETPKVTEVLQIKKK